jgi:hypothetical protein
MTLYDCWHDGMSLFREKVEADTPRQAAIEFSHYGYNCVQVVPVGKPLWQARTEVVNKPEPGRDGGYGVDPDFVNA